MKDMVKYVNGLKYINYTLHKILKYLVPKKMDRNSLNFKFWEKISLPVSEKAEKEITEPIRSEPVLNKGQEIQQDF